MVIYFFSLAAGAMTGLSPCILPVIPIMAGSSMSARKSGPLYIASGLVTSLVAVGLLFSVVTNVLGLDEEIIRSVSAWLLLTFGLVLVTPVMKEFMTFQLQGFGQRAAQTGQSFDMKSRVSQFAIGFLLGGAWSPCVGPALGAAFSLAGTQDGFFQAAAMMTAFGVGLSLPLLAIAYGLREYVLSRKQHLMKINEIGMKVLGASIALVGGMMLLEIDKGLEASLSSRLPDWFLRLSSML